MSVLSDTIPTITTTKGKKMINENTIYTTTEICWAVENDELCDGYGCAPCSIEFDGYYTPQYSLHTHSTN